MGLVVESPCWLCAEWICWCVLEKWKKKIASRFLGMTKSLRDWVAISKDVFRGNFFSFWSWGEGSLLFVFTSGRSLPFGDAVWIYKTYWKILMKLSGLKTSEVNKYNQLRSVWGQIDIVVVQMALYKKLKWIEDQMQQFVVSLVVRCQPAMVTFRSHNEFRHKYSTHSECVNPNNIISHSL